MKGIHLMLITALSTGGLLLAPTVTLADTLLIDSVVKNASVPRPQRGESMNSVENRFGAATESLAAVGHPPITRWVYPDFTVYFEYSHVIRSVVNKK